MDDQCLICDNQLCLKCKDPLRQPPKCQNYIQNQVMVQDQEGNNINLTCEIYCKICKFQPNYCLSCQGQNRQLGTNECQCAPGFYEPISELPDPQKKSDCQACSQNCLECYDYDKCTICKSKEININPVNQKCECQTGYKLNYHQNKCIKCFQYKDQVCYENCPNGTIPNEELNICQDQIEKNNQNSQYQNGNIKYIIFFIIIIPTTSYIIRRIYLKIKLKNMGENNQLTNHISKSEVEQEIFIEFQNNQSPNIK